MQPRLPPCPCCDGRDGRVVGFRWLVDSSARSSDSPEADLKLVVGRTSDRSQPWRW